MLSRAATVLKGAVRSSHQPLSKAASPAARPPGFGSTHTPRTSAGFHTAAHASSSSFQSFASPDAARQFFARLVSRLEPNFRTHHLNVNNFLARTLRSIHAPNPRPASLFGTLLSAQSGVHTLSQTTARGAFSASGKRAFTTGGSGSPFHLARAPLRNSPFGQGARAVTNVGLGSARNFSSGAGRPIFQNLVQNVPIALRALTEVDLDLDDLAKAADGKKMTSGVSVRPHARLPMIGNKTLYQGLQFVALPNAHAENAGVAAVESSVKKAKDISGTQSSMIDVQADLSHYFPVHHPSASTIVKDPDCPSDPYVTTLFIPLTPPSLSSRPRYEPGGSSPGPSSAMWQRDDRDRPESEWTRAHQPAPVNEWTNNGWPETDPDFSYRYTAPFRAPLPRYEDGDGDAYRRWGADHELPSAEGRLFDSARAGAWAFDDSDLDTFHLNHRAPSSSIHRPAHRATPPHFGSQAFRPDQSATELQRTYAAHAARVDALCGLLRREGIQVNTDATANEDGKGRVLKVTFEGWSADRVRRLLCDQGMGGVWEWCWLVEVPMVQAPIGEEDELDAFDWSAPLTPFPEYEETEDVGRSMIMPVQGESMSFVMPTLDFSFSVSSDSEHVIYATPHTSRPTSSYSNPWDDRDDMSSASPSILLALSRSPSSAGSYYEMAEDEMSAVSEFSAMDSDSESSAAWYPSSRVGTVQSFSATPEARNGMMMFSSRFVDMME